MIYLDFDDTLIRCARLSDAFTWFTPWTGEPSERMKIRKKLRSEFEALSENEQINHWCRQGGVLIQYGDEKRIAFARPGAYTFIAECLKIGTTHILTSGKTEYQTCIARNLGILLECYGRDRYNDVESNPNNILVDDLQATTLGVSEKMKVLGITEERFINVKGWNGQDQDRTPLTDVLTRLMVFKNP